ncbi:hypothetical protein glysoja_001715 [Glycine soja]|nr:hypothetical protein glysoja_001715 [Glycine soja]
MNIGAMVMDGSGFPALEKISALGYRDLMGEKIHQRRRKTPEEKSKETKEEEVLSSESWENSCTEEGEGESSTASSSSSPRTTALKDWNGVKELAGNKGLAMSASGFLCCLVTQRSVHQQLTPTNHTVER